jgi:hypothetical protein
VGGSIPNSVMDEIREIEHSNVELYGQRPTPRSVTQSKRISNFDCAARSSVSKVYM